MVNLSMADQKNEHALHLLSAAESMRYGDFLCDFTIKCSNECFRVHRLVLAAKSAYFTELFSRNATENSITLDDIAPEIMQQCITYMYTSSHTLAMASIPQILEATKALKIEQLHEHCFQYLQSQLNPNNSLHILNLSRTYCHKKTESIAMDVINENLEAVIDSKLFSDLSKLDIDRFMSNKNYVAVWRGAVTWCSQREDAFPSLVRQMDLSRFSFGFLLEVAFHDPLVQNSEEITAAILKEIFEDHTRLKKNLDRKNCFQLNRLSIDEKSKTILRSYLANNFTTIVAEPEFIDLPFGDFMAILNSLKVPSEQIKWESILKWVKSFPDERNNYFHDLFYTINLNQLPSQYLTNVIRQEELVKSNVDCMMHLTDSLLKQSQQQTSSRGGTQRLPEREMYDQHQGYGPSTNGPSRREASPSRDRGRQGRSGPSQDASRSHPNHEYDQHEGYEPSTNGPSRREASPSRDRGRQGRSGPSQDASRSHPNHEIQLGDRVVRGDDWEWGNEDGHGPGTVIGTKKGWAKVEWDFGEVGTYRIGFEGLHDLAFYSGRDRDY